MLSSRSRQTPLIAALFSVLLVLIIVTPAQASVLTSAQAQGVRDLLSSMESDQSRFALDGVDFHDTSVAGPIAIYQYTVDGLEHGCDAYFLMEDGQVVSLLREGFGNQFFSFASEGRYVADTLEKYSLSDFAIIQDVDGVHLTDGSAVYYSYRPYIEDEDDLISLSESANVGSRLSAVELNNLNEADFLDYQTPAPQRSFGYKYGYKYCQVGHVVQNLQTSCWAACCAMIINYHLGTNYQDYDILLAYNSGGHSVHDSGSPEDVQTILNWYIGSGLYSIYDACPTYYQIKTVIDADHPFVARVRPYPHNANNGESHAIVVNGYSSNNQCICLWDPSYDLNEWEIAQPYYGYYYYIPFGTASFYAYINATVYR